MKKFILFVFLIQILFLIFPLNVNAQTSPTPYQLDLTQLTSNGNGRVTFSIDNAPANLDYSSFSAVASWDNSNWPYAIWYHGGCPDACEIEWQGQNNMWFYVRLYNQDYDITFNQSVYGGAFVVPTVSPTPIPQLDLEQLSSDSNGRVTFKILNPPADFNFTTLSATASWDNLNWLYAVWYEGGCPDACVVNWQGQTTSPYYVRLTNQLSSITFNQYLNPALVNILPEITMPTSTTISEGDTYSTTGTFTDPDTNTWTGTVDYGDGSGVQSLSIDQINKTFDLSHEYTDEGTGSYTVTVTIDDAVGGSDTESATVNVNNVDPTVEPIVAPIDPVLVNTEISVSADFSDPGILDTHTAVWDWGDNTNSNGVVTETDGSGAVTGAHTYTTAGVYEVTLTVTDNDGGVGSATFQYISVYSPTPQGLFTAGQKFASVYPGLSGNAKFGLSYKYQGEVPVGNRQLSMEIKSAGFEFNADTISSLVISNGIGTLRGSGEVNGIDGYDFLVVGDENTDMIRIKISDSIGDVIFDTQPGDPENAAPTTSVTGNVLAH